MKLRFLALALLPLLGGCQAVQTAATVLTFNVANPVTDVRLQQVHAAYGIYLDAARQYWNGEDAAHQPYPPGLPACRVPVREPCAHRAIVLRLQGATRAASDAVRNLDQWVAANPNVGAGAVWDAATRAIAAGNAVLGR